MKIILASNNKGKIKEFKEILSKFNIEIVSLEEIGFTGIIEEAGNTFKENALIKAKTIFDIYNIPVLSDDSGICIRALNYEPGIYSARYHGLSDGSEKNNFILKKLENITDRYAFFECSIILYLEKDKYHHFKGIVEGNIDYLEKGEHGFGYDPIFIPMGYNLTFGELGNDVKHQISHRGKAVKAMLEYFENDFNN